MKLFSLNDFIPSEVNAKIVVLFAVILLFFLFAKIIPARIIDNGTTTTTTSAAITDALQGYGTFNAITEYNGWTAYETDTDGAFSHDTAEYKAGSGSLKGNTIIGRKKDWDGEYMNRTTASIDSNSKVQLNWSWRKDYTVVAPERQTMTIDLIKPDATSVNLWTNTNAIWGTWIGESLDISDHIDQTGNYQIRLGCSLKSGNDKNAQAMCWFDEVFLYETPPTYGTLNVKLTAPTDGQQVNQSETFTINATVTCEGGTGVTCGTVYAYARYVPSGGTGNYSYDGWNFSVTAAAEPRDIQFNGTHFWILGRENKKVYRYLANGTYDNWDFSVLDLETDPTGLYYNGTHFWVVGYGNTSVFRYLANGTYDNWYFNVSTQDTEPTAIAFNGTYFWVTGKSSATVYRYNATGDYNGWNFDVDMPETLLSGLYFNGTHFWVVGYGSDIVYRYLANGTYDNWNFNTSAQDTKPTGITFNGTHFWIVGKYNHKVYRYSEDITTPYTDINQTSGASPFYITYPVGGETGNYSYDGWSFSVSNNPRDLTFNGTYFWTVDQDTDSVHRYNASGDYEDSFDVSAQESTPVGLTFNGTYFWVVGYDNDTVERYLANGTYDNWNFSVNAQDDEPTGVYFNGTYFWVVGRNTDTVYRYDANGNYDGWSFYVGAESQSPSGIYFNGEYFWITDRYNGAVYRYDAGGNYDNWLLNTSSEDNSITGVYYNGTYFWISGRDSDKVLRYVKESSTANSQTSPFALNQGDSWNVSWTVNATGLGSYEIDVFFDSSYGNANVPDNDTVDATVEIIDTTELAIDYEITLSQGWNLISFPLEPVDTSIEAVLADIMDYVIVVNGFEGGGGGAKTYDPDLPEFSDLQEMDYLHGYWIKVTENVTLTVYGMTPSSKTINLYKNWNLISYLCDSPKNVEDVFAGIMDKVIVIHGFEDGALTYDPQLPEFSDLEEMKPGFGYWVKMNESAVLDYASVC